MIRSPSDRHTTEACGSVTDVCREYNMSLPESWFVEGRSVVGFPTSDCISNPDQDKCAMVQDYGCPTGFAMMISANFTVSRCVPMSVNEVYKAELLKEILDPNRCAEGYELTGTEGIDPYSRRATDKPIGSCNKL